MMAIFDKWTKGNPQAEEWTTYTYVDGRKTNTFNSTKKDEIVFAMGEVLKLIFNSDDPDIIETDEDIQTMGLKAVVRFMEEITSKKKGNQPTSSSRALLDLALGRTCRPRSRKPAYRKVVSMI